MDIQRQLEKGHSRVVTDEVVHYVATHPAALSQLLNVFYHGETKIVQRAAMAVGNLAREKPKWFVPHHARLVAYANDPQRHAAVKRNVSRYFSELPLEEVAEEVEGPLLDFAFDHFARPEVPVGIRVFCMQIVYHFSRRYPELRDELREIIERELAEGEVTAGFRSRGGEILRKLGAGNE